jgi:ubiquinone/menaquinone biosynthesis C-methylase UbiE
MAGCMTTQPAHTWQSAEAAEVWRQGAARRAETLALATERMLRAAQLAPGMRVLDIAAGTGDQSVLAARLVGTAGSVLATDISATMLQAAEEAAREAGLSNITTQVADASTIELPQGHFDAAICRFGLMFVPDLHQALTRIQRALKPGAKFATLVWSTEARNPWMGLQVHLLREMGRMPTSPPPSIVRALSLSEPGKVDGALRTAGFHEVQVTRIETPRRFGSIEETMQAMRSASPAQGELTRELNDAERERYATELESRLRAYSDPDGSVSIPGEAILVVGSR